MSTRHNTTVAPTVAAMTRYTLQAKAAPFGEAATADPTTAAPEAPVDAVEEVETHEWAGDLYDGDDITDPAQAFRSFQGQAGETAWLDRADDGTLTAWVRDADGSAYRYTDADAWAIDVDQAGMTDVTADPVEAEDDADTGVPDDVEPVDGEEGLDDASTGDLPESPEAPEGGDDEPPASGLDDVDSDESEPPAGDATQDASADEEDGQDASAEEDGEEGEEDDLEQMLSKLEGKSWPGLDDTYRLTIRRV